MDNYNNLLENLNVDNLLINVDIETHNREETIEDSNISIPEEKVNHITILLKQYAIEEKNSRIYKQVALWLRTNGYKSYVVWERYAEEELQHAKRILDYFITNNIYVQLPQIESPDISISSIYDAISITNSSEYENMKNLSTMHDNLKEYINSNNDMLLHKLCQDLLIEQCEEVNKVTKLTQICYRTTDLLFIDDYIANNF